MASIKVRKTRKALRAAKLQLETVKRRGHIEEIFWRFPHIGTQILEELDIPSLGTPFILTKIILKRDHPLMMSADF